MLRVLLLIITALLSVPASGSGQGVSVHHPGPEWTKMLVFSGHVPASKGPMWSWSAGFHIQGGTVRAVGKLTSDDPNTVGLSLALQRRKSGKWVDSAIQPDSGPNDEGAPLRGIMAVDWATTKPLQAGDYRLGIMNPAMVGERFVLTMYLRK